MSQPNDWIEWKGGDGFSPVPLDAEPSVMLRMGVVFRLTNNGHHKWVQHDHPADIIAYRLAKASS